MAGDRIASGEIYVEVNDRDAHARLAALRAAYHRTMEEIDREEATATVDADLTKFDRKIAKAQKALDKFEKAEAEAKLDANIEPLEKKLARAKAELAKLGGDDAVVELDAEAAGLHDQIRRAKAELAHFTNLRADAELDADTSDLDEAIAGSMAKLEALDKEKVRVEFESRGFAKLMGEIEATEKAIDAANKKALKATEDRIDAEDKLAEATAERARAVEAHEKKVQRAREAADRKRQALAERAEQRINALEEQQYRRTLTRVKRESKIREDAAKLQEQTQRGLTRARDEYDKGMGFHYQGYKGNLVRQLEALNEARRKASGDTKKLQALEERETRIRENLGRVTRKLRQFEQFKADDDRIKRELAEVPKLEAAYAHLNNQLDALDKKRRKALVKRDQRTVFTAELDARQIKQDMDRLGDEIRHRSGRDPIVFQAQARFSERAGRRLRQDFIDSAGNPGDALARSLTRGAELGAARAGRVFDNRFRRAINGGRGMRGNAADAAGVVGTSALRGLDMIRKFGDGIASATVRIGPFTMTLRKAAGAIAILSPILVDVVGALGALVGVAGSALVGVAALGGGLLGGAIPAFLGMGLVVKDVVQDFSKFKKAQKAYDDAVAKNGKSSDQAKKKLTELNRITGGLSGTTQKQIKLAQALGDRWDAATRPGRASVFKALGEGIKTASDLLPTFAKKTNEGLNVAERGLTGWARQLRSSTGKAVLSTLMTNFNQALGPALRGLGQFVAYLGKASAIASRSLPGLANTFENWSKGLNDSTKETGKFVGGIHGVVRSAKDVGNVFLSAGRLTKAFFGAGVRDGQKFSRSLSSTMDRWTAGFKTPQGRESLQNFFRESVDGAKSLYHFLAPIGATFVGWARALSPIARGFFDGAAAVARFVQSIAEATALQGPIQALAATLGTLWALGKIGGAAAAVGRFSAALFGIRGGATAAAAAQVRLGAAGAASARGAAGPNAIAAANARVAQTAAAATAAQARLGGAAAASAVAGRSAGGVILPAGAAARGPAAAAAATSRLSKAGAGASRVLAGLSTVVLGVGSATAGLALVVGAAAVGYYMYSKRTRDWQKNLQMSNKALKDSQAITASLGGGNLALAQTVVGAAQSTLELNTASKQYASTQKQLNALVRAGKKGSQEYNDLQDQAKQQALGLQAQRLADLDMQRQVTAGRKAESKAIADANKVASQGLYASKRAQTDIGKDKFSTVGFGHDKIADYYKKVEKSAQAAGMGVRDFINAQGDGKLFKQKDELLAYADATDKVKENQRNLTRTQQEGELQAFNMQRAMNKLGPIASSHARIFAQLGQQAGSYGKKIQQALNSTKYADPSKAASAAKAANSALKSGVSGKQVLKIVADSSSAEQAIRRLKAVRLSTLVQKIKTEGAEGAKKALIDLVGAKVAPKVVKVLAESGSAESKIKALIAMGIPPKVAKLLAKDAASSIVDKLKGLIQTVQGKTVFINASTSGTGGVMQLASAINGVQSKSVSVHASFSSSGSIKMPSSARTAAVGAVNMSASGGIETPATLKAQDRALSKMMRGTLPRMSTTQAQMGGKVSGPRAVWGEEPNYPEFVLSSNPSYRKRNVGFLKQAASALGVQMSAKGAWTAGPRATSAQKSKAGRSAEKKIKSTKGKKGDWSSPSAQSELNAVDAAFVTKERKEFDIQRAEGKLKEPTSFVEVVGQDNQGNDIVQVNQSEVNRWSADLMGISKMYQELVDMISNIKDSLIPTAQSAVKAAKATALKNIGPLKNAIKREDDIIAKKKVKNVAKDEARARKAVYSRELKENQKVNDNADSDLSSLTDRSKGLEEEKLTAEDSRDSYAAESGAVSGDAAAQAKDDNKAHAENVANQQAGTGEYAPGGSLGPPTKGQELDTKLNDLNLEAQLSELGQGFKGQPVRTKDQIDADRQTTGQSMIDTGNSMLVDTNQDGSLNTSNDDEARGLISAGAGVLSDLLSSSGSTPNALQAAFNTASGLRDELYKQFGSNLISRGGDIASMMAGHSNVARGLGGSSTGGGGTIVNLRPTFKTQPSDPHLWSRDVAFELQAAI